ncbi:hypothetical protein M446_0504 [Methylobacterium sp. 4-46]|uniref:hypothetical protein n=1 Tax=unclassified Methylobacterium TaxID=2615210 RepID=UPI000165C931|nr:MULTISPECIES: hypothetical protein [Methylobacterium]ACA15067.1 hypothetical protein M446_0504 [Methylobacterium sp. 4-46]WFT80803.1 hypothetical protein QA634_02560 [Methylobacterium nodulans]
MNARTLVVAAAAALSLLGPARAEPLAPARAGSLGPAQARSIDLGPLAGVAYYTPEPRGYHVVVTLAPRAAAPAVRLEGVLAEGQSLTVSTPRQSGAAARVIEIRREGDAVSVSAGPVEVQETAALR